MVQLVRKSGYSDNVADHFMLERFKLFTNQIKEKGGAKKMITMVIKNCDNEAAKWILGKGNFEDISKLR